MNRLWHPLRVTFSTPGPPPPRSRWLLGAGLVALAWGTPWMAACGADAPQPLVMAGSAVGTEGRLLRRQLDRFVEQEPGLPVSIRTVPDAADERHQLFVQWLNAHLLEPDVLQLDVTWTAEFAAAGWIRPLDPSSVRSDEFFPVSVAANRWRGRLYAVPWFADVGMLYWRSDLLDAVPASLEELRRAVRRARDREAMRYGLVWQGARYEGLVTVFIEYLGAFGGRILDASGGVEVDAPAAVRALEAMRADVAGPEASVPSVALAWREEQTRFAFQNGDAVAMRNWPYAAVLLSDPASSRVAGRFRVSPMPAAAGGAPTAALGGSQLAVNARTRHPDRAAALIAFLTAPEQMLERAREVGQFPTRPALFDEPALQAALPVPAADARRIIEHAVPRPVTPVYAELSDILQVRLHEVLTGQRAAGPALQDAAVAIRALLARAGLSARMTKEAS